MGNDVKEILSDINFITKYAQTKPDGSKESWEDAVERIWGMHYVRYKKYLDGDNGKKLKDYMNSAKQMELNKAVLSAQRARQFANPDPNKGILKHNGKIYNCSSAYMDKIERFSQTMYGLLEGSGVGLSLQFEHISKLPKFMFNKTGKGIRIFIIPDTIEGWADAIDVLINSYLDGSLQEWEFDYSLIRPKGSLIANQFKAPGPDGLNKSIDKIREILDAATKDGSRKLYSIEIYDIIMWIADAVLSGGVRRSATIMLFSPSDDLMLNAKIGNWYNENPQRRLSNNTVMLNRETVTKEQFDKVFESVKEFGEPGFGFTNSIHTTFNPCFTGDTIIAVADGRNGVSIKELSDNGIEFDVYSAIYYRGKWKTEIKKAKSFSTGFRDIIEITLSNGDKFECTPDHKLALLNGEYVEAYNSLGKSIEGFYSMLQYNKANNRMINTVSNAHSKQSRMIWEFNNGKYKKGFCIDHKLNGGGDFINNLQLLTIDEHNIKSGSERLGYDNGIYKVKNNKDYLHNSSVKSMMENNSNFSGLSDFELIKIGRSCLLKYGKITLPLCIKIENLFPRSFSKNRFGGKLSNFKDIILNKTKYESPIKKEFINWVDKNKSNHVSKYKLRNLSVVKIEEVFGTEEVFDLTVEDNHNFYILTSGDKNYDYSNGLLVHNCYEIGKSPIIPETNETGFQVCNLSEINGSYCTSEEKLRKAVFAATVIGTLQAGYTNFDYLGDVTKRIVEREALLGVSITGWMANPRILFNEKIMINAARYAVEVNKEVAQLIGINQAARVTTTKPSGNASVLLKTPSGIHGEHSEMFIRNIQMNIDEVGLAVIKEQNKELVEDSFWSNTDNIVSFPLCADKGSILKKDLIGVEQLKYVEKAQNSWVLNGMTPELCTIKGTTHNVSNTIQVPQGGWEAVRDFIWDRRYIFSGISLLSLTGDLDYPQAPFQSVKSSTKLVEEYGAGSIFASGLIVDTEGIYNSLWDATDSVKNKEDFLILEDREEITQKRLYVPKSKDGISIEEFASGYWKNNIPSTYEKYESKRDLLFDVIIREIVNVIEGDNLNIRILKNKKSDWVRRFNKFSKNYFNSDDVKTINCLKDVQLLHRWTKLSKTIKPINWDGVDFTGDNKFSHTNVAIACGGGTCEI